MFAKHDIMISVYPLGIVKFRSYYRPKTSVYQLKINVSCESNRRFDVPNFEHQFSSVLSVMNVKTRSGVISIDCNYTDKSLLHCKKDFVFPVPSLDVTKLSENNLIIPGQGEFG
jgi:hypothetical protein